MRNLPVPFQERYEQLLKAYPDILVVKKPMMNVSDVLRAYFILADFFTDESANPNAETMLVEVLHGDMLISAVARQIAEFGGVKKYVEPLHISATLFYGLVKNHCFVDGNKRTALLTLLYEMDCYGYVPAAGVREFERLTTAVADDKLDEKFRKEWRQSKGNKDMVDRRVETIYRCLKQRTKKKDSTFHIDITAGEFISAMNRIEGCECRTEGTKIKMERTIQRKWPWEKPKTLKYAISFGGKTRTIGAGTIREALSHLELYEQYADYQSLMNGEEPRYMLIERFEGPLRRLKDK